MSIPKRIILTGQSIYLRQPSHVDCLKQFSAIHPDWEVVFYGAKDAREFMAERWPAMLAVYEDFEWIEHRNTLVALMVALELGGVYFHPSMWLEHGMDELLENPLVLGQAGEMMAGEFADTYGEDARDGEHRRTISLDGFACEPGHWFIRKALENFISVAQEQEALRTGLDSGRQEPTFFTMTYAMESGRFGTIEKVLPVPESTMLGAFGKYASRIA